MKSMVETVDEVNAVPVLSGVPAAAGPARARPAHPRPGAARASPGGSPPPPRARRASRARSAS